MAHRGGKSSYKENTLGAFQFGLKHGAHALEMDVRFDHLRHRFYLEHDFFHFPWDNFNIVDKVFPHLPENIPLFIELKSLSWLTKNYAREFLKVIKRFNLEKRATIISFNPFVLRFLQKLEPSVQIGFSIRSDFWENQFYRWVYHVLKPKFLVLRHKMINKKIIDFAKKREIRTYIFTANTPEDWQKAKDFEIEGVITDYPSEAWEAVGKL